MSLAVAFTYLALAAGLVPPVLNHLNARRREEAGRQLESRYRVAYNAHTKALVGSVRGHTVHVYERVRGLTGATTSHIVVRDLPAGITLRPQKVLDELVGATQVKVGDRDFNTAFFLDGPESYTLALIDADVQVALSKSLRPHPHISIDARGELHVDCPTSARVSDYVHYAVRIAQALAENSQEVPNRLAEMAREARTCRPHRPPPRRVRPTRLGAREAGRQGARHQAHRQPGRRLPAHRRLRRGVPASNPPHRRPPRPAAHRRTRPRQAGNTCLRRGAHRGAGASRPPR